MRHYSDCSRCAYNNHGHCYRYECDAHEERFPSIHKRYKTEKLQNWMSKNVKYISKMLRRKNV